MYGDESFTNFFRRLTFSPDGGLLLTPSGHFEDPSNIGPLMGGGALVGGSGSGSGGAGGGGGEGEILRGRRGHPSDEYLDDTGSVGGAGAAATAAGDPSGSGSGNGNSGSGGSGSGGGGSGSASSVFIYSRANFARPPIGQLPGHKKASIAVKFSPVLYSLRAGVVGASAGAGEEQSQSQSQSQSHGHEHGHGHGSGSGSGSRRGGQTVNVAIERGMNEIVDVDMVGLGPGSTSTSMIPESYAEGEPSCSPSKRGSQPPSQPQSQSDSWSGAGAAHTLPSPALSAIDGVPRTPGKRDRDRGRRSGGSGSTSGPGTGTVFALPYRMLFAVATMDSISIHDTQQAGPIALLTKLHYDEFTDMTWSVGFYFILSLVLFSGFCFGGFFFFLRYYFIYFIIHTRH